MNFDEAKAAIEKAPNGPEILEVIANSINEAAERERAKGIEIKRKLDNENRVLRVYKNKIQDLGFNPDAEGADVDEFIADLKETTAVAADKTKPEYSELDKSHRKLQADFSKLQGDFQSAQQEALELKQRTTTTKLKDALGKHLRDKVYGADFVVNDLVSEGRVSLSENDQVVWVKGSGETAQKIELEKGVAEFLAEHKEIVKSNQTPGSGSSGGQPSAPQATGDLARIQQLRKLGHAAGVYKP